MNEEVQPPSGESLAGKRTGKRLSARRIVVVILVTVGGAYLAYVLFIYFYQAHLVYFPEAKLESTPAAEGLTYEDLHLETADGVRIHGWYVPAAGEARGTVLFCHGNAGNISHRLDSVRIFHRLGLNVLIFDYRGYGQSEGTPTEEGTYLDAEAAWVHLTTTRGIPPERIVIFGRSLGGAVAAHLAVKHPPAGLIIESAGTSAADMGAEMFPLVPVRWICRFRYDAEADVAKVRCPVLIVHSRDDELMPFHHGRALFRAAPEPTTFLEITGGHNTGFLTSGERYTDGLDAFMEKVLGDRPGDP